MITDVRTGKSDVDEARKTMQCTPAQMRIALHRKGLLETVNNIAASDAEAAIVWDYATVIVRDSPFIAALGVDFSDDEIDAIFKDAMNVRT